MNGTVVRTGIFPCGEYAYPPKVRILVTPGFTNTGRSQQDAFQNESITTQINSFIDSVTAVVALVGGTRGPTVPDALRDVPIGTDSPISTLSTICPQNPINDVAPLLTNVSTLLNQNFSRDTTPDTRKDTLRFLLNNSVTVQKKYIKLKDGPHVKQGTTDPPDAVKADEQHSLEMLVEFFDWLYSLEPQPTTEEGVPPHHISAWMGQVTNSAIFASLAGGTRVPSAMGKGCELEARNQPPDDLGNLLGNLPSSPLAMDGGVSPLPDQIPPLGCVVPRTVQSLPSMCLVTTNELRPHTDLYMTRLPFNPGAGLHDG